MSDWNAELYRRFEAERTRPAADLLARVGAEQPALVVDIGCGPGNSTELLVRRFAGAELVGIDTSPDMLESARARLPAVRFERADVASWTPDRAPDVLFANATLQWVPDHPRLYPRLFAMLAPGGWLAVQVPDNFDEPSHTAMREVALAAGLSDVVAAAETDRSPIGSFEEHWSWLAPSAASVDLWRTTYVHPLAGPDAVVDWLRGTGLRPYLARLAPPAQGEFLAAYRDAVARAYPPRPDGTVLLRFPRLFVVAQRR
jgi:trans-aconitate 2-methyltransferase